MNEICYSLSDDLINPHKHIIGGDYDANVVIIALENKGYSTNWIDKRKEYKVKKNLKGLLVNSQKERKFYHKIFKLSARHWATVVRDNDMYYHCDSEKEQL